MLARRVVLVAVLGLIGHGPAAAQPAAPAPTPAGSWWVGGHGVYGELGLTVDADGKLGGTTDGQPVAGTFDPKTRRLTFTRYQNAADTTGRQAWTGLMLPIPDTKPVRHTLHGGYRSIAGSEWGRPDTEYNWAAWEK